MKAPRLNRALALENPVSTPDGAGGFAQSWVELGHLWADVAFRSGRETAAGGGARSVASYKITVRAAPVGSTMRPRAEQRFREGTRLFRILSVAEKDAEGRYLICIAQEEAAA
ncbi:head-tail adaptor protein [Thalassovita sp.]|uniref:head-tail adaptor protein n=1 Tax=Thalassovita sp. TaxID=1979401 RepID=UPI0028816E87|nr:head-tail adaptor protein [Thalassovita sp.]MDF1801570.1 head-tail adaptor protein [Thalassovita sp.]